MGHSSAIISSLLALTFAFIVIALGLWLSGLNTGAVFSALLSGAAGDSYRLAETCVKACPLLLTGLAVALALQAGLWNIGAEGQFLIGALSTAWAGQYVTGLPSWLALPFVWAAGMVGGAVWASAPALLKIVRGINEVISTIMMNFIAAGLISYCVHGPLMETQAQYPQTNPLPSSAQLARFFSPTRLHLGIGIALLAAIMLHTYLFYTKAGLKLRASGANPLASRFAGINVNQQTLLALALSGALAGLAGSIEVCGVTYRVYEKFSPGYGYTAIAVALVGQRSPLGIIGAAILFGALEAASGAIQRNAGVSSVLVSVIQAVIVFSLAVCSTEAAHRFLREKLRILK